MAQQYGTNPSMHSPVSPMPSRPPMSHGNGPVDQAVDKAEGVVEQAKSMGQDALEQAKEKGQQATGALEDTANTGIDRAAGAAQGLADTLRDKAQSLPGDKATEIANQAAGGLERGAEYLRQNDVADMRGDLEGVIRRYPAQSLMVGLAVGFLVARAFR